MENDHDVLEVNSQKIMREEGAMRRTFDSGQNRRLFSWLLNGYSV